MNNLRPRPAKDYDSDDSFNSTYSTDVEDNGTPNYALDGEGQATQPPPNQSQIPLCIVRNLSQNSLFYS
jgi:hypothetical protein